MPGAVSVPPTPGTCGPTSSPPFAYWDRASWCWRTSQGTFDLGSTSSSVTLPKRGSMRGGALYGPPTSAPATSGPDCSLLPTPNAPNGGQQLGEAQREGETWRREDGTKAQAHLVDLPRLLPTPAANQYEMADVDGYLERREREAQLGRNGNGFGLVLSMAVKMLPSPAAWDAARGPDYAREGREDSGGDDLVTTVAKLLPTPTGSDHKGSSSPASAKEWEHRGTNLPEAVQHLPTPTARDHKGRNQRDDTTCLPGAVERLLPTPTAETGGDGERPSGFRRLLAPEIRRLRGGITPPPSRGGSPSSDVPLPGQLTMWDD